MPHNLDKDDLLQLNEEYTNFVREEFRDAHAESDFERDSAEPNVEDFYDHGMLNKFNRLRRSAYDEANKDPDTGLIKVEAEPFHSAVFDWSRNGFFVK